MKEAREKVKETEDVQRSSVSQAPCGAARLLKNGFGASKAD